MRVSTKSLLNQRERKILRDVNYRKIVVNFRYNHSRCSSAFEVMRMSFKKNRNVRIKR